MPGSAPLRVNRAPVLTLWAAVVAERLGYPSATALTLGRAVAGYSAQAKARRLGLVEEREPGEERREAKKPVVTVRLLGRQVPVVRLPDGSVRAQEHGKPASDQPVLNYLRRAFGDRLDEVREVMERLAVSMSPAKLNEIGFHLYEQFRPSVPEGVSGWGAKGELRLERIRRAQV